jgi:hypothetical protein
MEVEEGMEAIRAHRLARSILGSRDAAGIPPINRQP